MTIPFLILQTSADWFAIFKQAGTVGVVCVFFGLAIWKIFIPMMQSSLEDARKERDRMAGQLERQANEFTASLKYRDDKFRDIADAIDRAARK